MSCDGCRPAMLYAPHVCDQTIKTGAQPPYWCTCNVEKGCRAWRPARDW